MHDTLIYCDFDILQSLNTQTSVVTQVRFFPHRAKPVFPTAAVPDDTVRFSGSRQVSWSKGQLLPKPCLPKQMAFQTPPS